MKDYSLTTLLTAEKVPFKFDGRVLYHSEDYELVYLTLNSGESMEMHSQPFEVVFFVLEGKASLTVGDQVVAAEPGFTVSVRSGVTRAWRNSGNVPFRVLVNKLIGKI
jgi:quercetin dioxygenase-like cupin family protein